jgi:hypothetical protein
MSRKPNKSYNELMELAEVYGVKDNALFTNAASQYELQKHVIDLMREEIDNNKLTCEKSYTAGEKNIYASPLLKELPKHIETANKTLLAMLEIINKLGHKKEVATALDAFNKEFS